MSRKYSNFQFMSERGGSQRMDWKRKSSAAIVADILEKSDNNEDLSKIYDEDYDDDEDESGVYANIKVQTEIINSVRYQPWSMSKKLKLQRLAKNYVMKHEGKLSKGHGYQEKGAKLWKLIKREIINICSLLTPWEMRVKGIESHFGSVVASYFVFLRWLIWVNVWLTLLPVCFVLIPEGILKYSPIFYGYYDNNYIIGDTYRLPLAYLLTGFASFALSFIVVLRKMAANSRQSRLSNKDEQFTFSWRLFSSWDYMIGNAETATNKVASIVTSIRELILEEKEKQKSTERRQLILFRILANVCTVMLLALSTYIIQLCVERSRQTDLMKRQEHTSANFWDENELTIVMTLISTLFPSLFDIVSMMEKYHPRTTLRWQLTRMSRKYSNFQFMSERGGSQRMDWKRKSSAAIVADILEKSDNNEDLSKIYDEDYDDDEDESGVYANIKVQTEIINSVRYQPWSMSKKLKLQRLAKNYVIKHEGKLSKGHGYQEKGAKLWKLIKREIINICSLLTPWEMRVKGIESHFGSVVASYFVFLRWLIWVNVWLTLLPVCFVLIPEIVVGEPHGSIARKRVPEDQEETYADLKTIWDAEGILKYSPIFYGYYDNNYVIGDTYRLPLAYLLTGFASFAFSFIVVLRKMAANSRQSRLSNKDEQFTFSWRLFSSWDYMIGNAETATNKVASIVTSIRELILEEKEKQKSTERRRLILFRILANICTVMLLALSTYIIQLCVERSRHTDLMKRQEQTSANFWDENELTIVMTLISTIFPSLFDIVSMMEKYHPRTTLRWQLTRVFMLNLLNLYTLFIALFWKQQDQAKEIERLLQNTSQTDCGTAVSSTYLAPSLNTTSSYGHHDDSFANSTFPSILNLTTTWTVLPETQTPLTNSNCSQPQKSDISSDMCWETMIGQEVFKLTVMDLVFVLGTIIIQDFLRGLFVRYCNIICCWDLEKTFPEYGDFKTPENILHLINNQGVIWLGTFFAPGLPVLNLMKLLVLVYVRYWSVMVCNVPQDVIFRASKSSNFYYALLLIMLFLSMLPPLFAIVAVEPSPNCGPFSGRKKMFHILTETIDNELPPLATSILEYAASPGVIIPVFMLLIMTIYYLVSVSKALKEANSELKNELNYERSEGKRRIYAMADAKRNLDTDENGHSAMTKKKRKGLSSAVNSVMAAARIAKMLSKPSRESKEREHQKEDESKRANPIKVRRKDSHPLAPSSSVVRATQTLRNAIRAKKARAAMMEHKTDRNEVVAEINALDTATEYDGKFLQEPVSLNTGNQIQKSAIRPINIQISGAGLDDVSQQNINWSSFLKSFTAPPISASVGTQTFFHEEDESPSRDKLSAIQKYKVALHKKRKNQRQSPNPNKNNRYQMAISDESTIYDVTDLEYKPSSNPSVVIPQMKQRRRPEIQIVSEKRNFIGPSGPSPDVMSDRKLKRGKSRRFSMQVASNMQALSESRRRFSFPPIPEILVTDCSDSHPLFSEYM